VLYSWTTDKQIDELRSNPVLLTRSESSTGAHTNLSQVMNALADTGNPLALVLTGGAFIKGRYGWTNPWATLRGWPDESYGNRLLRIVLKPDAWFAVLDDTTLTVVDLNNAEVPMTTVLGTPERIGAVFFMHRDANNGACGTFVRGCANGTYREYFINNEAMVEEWSFETQDILDELNRSIAFVQAVRDQAEKKGLAPSDCDFSLTAYCRWGNKSGLFVSVDNAYMTGLALTSVYYTPTIANLDALLAALQDSLFDPDPFVHKP
jgi:hypothetical protein